jgi:DNA (cytosine-5)-methyltransferase 1
MIIRIVTSPAKIKSDKAKGKAGAQKVFRLGEFFCGPGGIGLGAIKSQVSSNGVTYSFAHAWANDFDPDTCETYRRNICPREPESVVCGDIRKIDLKQFGPIEAFAYGFPCNDFSIVGEHKGFDGEFGPLYSYGVRIIDRLKPKIIFAENVGGIASANEGKAFKQILSDLENAGNKYNLSVNLYRFEEYGIPQARHRIIIIGIEKSLGLRFKVPAPTFKIKTSRSAIEEPPIKKNAANHELTKQSATVVERLTHTKPGENAWNADLPRHLQLNVKQTRLSHIYKRLDPNKPSYTITGSGGGGTHGYHWKEPRALTNRERARLQTFPDSYIFEGPKESVRKQIGMAVSPDMAGIIFTCILKTFAGIDYPSVNPSFGSQLELFANGAKK